MKNLFNLQSLLVLCLLFSARAEAQSVPEWTVDINAFPDSAYVFPVRVLNDGSNHVLVLSTYLKSTGINTFENKIYLNKYSAAGVLDWSLIYDNNGNGQPRGYDMAIDPSGNCYIAGGFMDPAINKPLLLKVSSAGSVVWQRDSTNAFNSTWCDQVIYDNNRLYLKATNGIATFDLNGLEIWSLGDMQLARIAVDHAGQMIVSAIQTGNHTLFRYDSAGILNFSDSTMLARRIAIDFNNNIYLITDILHYQLVKYDSAGNFAWSQSAFPPPPPYGDIGCEVVTDFYNDVLAVGLSGSMFKFTPQGSLVWQKSMNGMDNYIISAKITTNNLLAVAGTIAGINGYDMKVAMFNLNGDENWSGFYSSNDIQEFPVDMTIDYSGIYVIEDNISNTSLVKFTSPFNSTVNFDLICVDSVWYDAANPNFINVKVFNGDINSVNYPSVQIISPQGDTIGNPDNFVNFFLHGSNSYQTYTDTITVTGIADFGDYTFLISEGFGVTTEEISWCIATGISNPEENKAGIYPNPVHDVLFVKKDGFTNENCNAAIYHISGAKVFEQTLSGDLISSIDVSAFATGVYFICVTGGNQRWSAKFVKQ